MFIGETRTETAALLGHGLDAPVHLQLEIPVYSTTELTLYLFEANYSLDSSRHL